jgi:hypothetical protein
MLLILVVFVAAEVSTYDTIPVEFASVIEVAGGFKAALVEKLEADKTAALLSMVGGRLLLLLLAAAFEADGAPEIGLDAVTDDDDAPAAPLCTAGRVRDSTWFDGVEAAAVLVVEFIADGCSSDGAATVSRNAAGLRIFGDDDSESAMKSEGVAATALALS